MIHILMINIAMKVLLLLIVSVGIHCCNDCYPPQKCSTPPAPLTLHVSVHPHLDAYWIYNFTQYYGGPTTSSSQSYFASNRFTNVRQIFNTAKRVLLASARERYTAKHPTQSAYRSFMNSEMGFFAEWYDSLNAKEKGEVKELVSSGYWEVLGGGVVEHDEACTYVDDILENYQLGLAFLKQSLQYYPTVAISADSFGHSQSTAAILAHIGIEGFLVERSDQHILQQNKSQFIWKVRSANNLSYGAMPTHIRWAIHGFQDQFIINDQSNLCQSKQTYFDQMKDENIFLRSIHPNSKHLLRYFGHDFQQFTQQSYQVIQAMMEYNSRDKCSNTMSVYSTPTQYWKQVIPTLHSSRSQDIMPIWDYDSALFWTGYFTTDPYHKYNFRTTSRLLHNLRSLHYTVPPLTTLAKQVAYLQHHDGMSGTSKYKILDQLQSTNNKLSSQAKQSVLPALFNAVFPTTVHNTLFTCHLATQCRIEGEQLPNAIYLKILNGGSYDARGVVKIQLPFNKAYAPKKQKHQIVCFCTEKQCPCTLYLYLALPKQLSIILYATNTSTLHYMEHFTQSKSLSHNGTHLYINTNSTKCSISYRKIKNLQSIRHYIHLNRYGKKEQRTTVINSGKYALGNIPPSVRDMATIKSIHSINTPNRTIVVIKWSRYHMKSVFYIDNGDVNKEIKIQTYSAVSQLADYYLEVKTNLKSNTLYTDSNGWLVMERKMYKHQDYEAYFDANGNDNINGNTYPITAFAYIKDENGKLSVNVDRPQGVTLFAKSTLGFNFDRITTDDGKWVYQNTFRSQYQKFTHIITVNNQQFHQRILQRKYDEGVFIQGHSILSNQRIPILVPKVDPLNYQYLKINAKNQNQHSYLVRFTNLHDLKNVTIPLYFGHYLPLLSAYYDQKLSFDSIEEVTIGGNMKYQQFIKRKWNLPFDLKIQNSIFNKVMGENITLRPLEMRMFKIINIKSGVGNNSGDLKLDKNYFLNQKKQFPRRVPNKNQLQILKFIQGKDQCNGKSPVRDFKKQQQVSFLQPDSHKNQQNMSEQKSFQSELKKQQQQQNVKSQNNEDNSEFNSLFIQNVKQTKKERTSNSKFQDSSNNKQIKLQRLKQQQNNEKFSKQRLLKQIQQKVKKLKPLSTSQKQLYFRKIINSIQSQQKI